MHGAASSRPDAACRDGPCVRVLFSNFACSDSDELFLPSAPGGTLSGTHACEAGAATRHFAALAASGCECFVYHNFEAVPERLPAGAETPPASSTPLPGGPLSDPFTSVELFKVAESLIHEREGDTPAAAALDAWRRRNRANKFFLYYESGKCACRVDTDGLWVPASVHTCLPRQANGMWDEPRLHTRAWTNEVRNSGLAKRTDEASAVLHFPVWDPAALWCKYALHGDFSDELESGATTKGGLVWGECFHTECRDHYVAHRHAPDGGYSAMLELFRSVVMLTPNEEEEAARQIDLGLLIRLPHALAHLRTAKIPPAAYATNGLAAHERPPKFAHADGGFDRSHGYGVPSSGEETPAAAVVDGRMSSSAAAELLGIGGTGRAPPPVDVLSMPVWTAGQARRIAPFADHAAYALERLDWRGPKAWRPRLSEHQLAALRMMAGQKASQ